MSQELKKENPKRRLRWYQYLFCCWTLILILIGGVIGGALGVVAAVINVKIFRTARKPSQKYLVAFLVSCLAIVLWLILSAFVMMAMSSGRIK